MNSYNPHPKLVNCHHMPICIWWCRMIKSIIEYFSEICKYGIFKSEFLYYLRQLLTFWVAVVVEQKWYSRFLLCHVWCNLKIWSASQYTLFNTVSAIYKSCAYERVLKWKFCNSYDIITYTATTDIFWSIGALLGGTFALKIVNNFMLMIES